MQGRILSATTAVAALVALSPGLAGPAAGAEIPCGTARLIVPWSPGGETDIIFRTFAQAINATDVEPEIQVVNISGQGGNKGAKEARVAKPDGCTLFAIHQSAISSYLTGRVDFTWDAFQPVVLLTRTPTIVGSAPGVPYSDLNGLVDYAKAHPGEVDAGATLGSTSHFAILLLAAATGAEFNYVSYDGTRERMTALLANNIDIGAITVAAAKNYILEDQLKALGVYAEQPQPQIPEVETAKQQGIDIVFGTERGIMLPEGTPQEIVDQYVAVFKQAANDPEVMKQMEAKGTKIVFMPPDEYTQHLEQTFDQWEQIAIDVGIYAAG